MHIYNAWLPPTVREMLEKDPENEKFREVVREVQREWTSNTPKSRVASLKWISVINTFMKARSELDIEDVETLVKTSIDLLLYSADHLFIQIRWGQCITRVLKKYRNHLQLEIEWWPLYELLYNTHFKRRQSYEGLALKQIHLDTITSLVRSCRRFFSPDAVTAIWEKFRPSSEDISHNSALEAVGFISLFLPTKLQKAADGDKMFFTSAWLKDCLDLWEALPNSNYWDRLWASLLGRFIKHSFGHRQVDWDPFLPALSTHFLRSFEVPIGKLGTSSPVRRDIPRELVLAFNGGGWSVAVSKYFAKSIVYMLKPGGSAQNHLELIINLTEQYYHPSNGGSWTSSLEKFLHYLVYYFHKRLAFEQRSRVAGTGIETQDSLGPSERRLFVKGVLRLIERGQYSKDGYLAGTAATAASALAFVEPSLVLPLINSRFHTALNTMTATHQLESAVTTLALSARPIFLACAKESSTVNEAQMDMESSTFVAEYTETLVVAMFSTLLGMDANDPPKTLATIELYSSILCNVGIIGDEADGGSLALPMDWSQWLDEFLSRLFMLLVHLEPSSHSIDVGLDDGYDLSSSTFLMQGGSFYHSLIELLFGRLTRPLYIQALKKLSQFVHNNVLPGAAQEIGFLGSFAVFYSPAEAITQLLEPLMTSVVTCLAESPSTGFSSCVHGANLPNFKASLSSAVETSVTFQLNVLSTAMTFAGAHLLPYKELLNKVVAASFDAPSSKVTEAGNRLLSSVLSSLIFYYPLDQYKLHSKQPGLDGIEAWMDTKHCPEDTDGLTWHLPNKEEIQYANELLEQHLIGALTGLRHIFEDNRHSDSAGQDKEFLRVLFLRLDATLRGVGSCLPDFEASFESTSGAKQRPLTVVGSFGATVCSTKLREETAETLLMACVYLLKERADDTVLLTMLIRVMDLVGNCATLEYNLSSNGRHMRQAEAKCLTEPKMNFISNPSGKSKRRPRWLVVDMIFFHNAWRSSQSSYRPTYGGAGKCMVPYHVKALSRDLLKLSLHRYDVVRKFAVAALGKSLKRFPSLVEDCMPMLNSSLQDAGAIEDSALGACKVLTLRPVLRYLTQDWSALASFFLALLNSSHHESVKAQSAINELFIVFSVRFGGFLAFSPSVRAADSMTYDQLVSHIKHLLVDVSVSIHWRYSLMAHGMLLLLLVSPYEESSSKKSMLLRSRQVMAGQFLTNLKSELPALRPLSVIALLSLLQASPYKCPENGVDKKKCADLSLESTLAPIIQDEEFGGSAIPNLALDHHYPEGQGRGGQGYVGRVISSRISDIGLTALMPSFTRDWPRTRSWDPFMVGEAFSTNTAKLFKRLVQECGGIVLKVFRSPLEEALSATEERGKQCIAAEMIAGFLHSDVLCVSEAWHDWLHPLLRKALMQATVESVPEWAACIRFSVTGKGIMGKKAPLLRQYVLECLAEPLPPSSSTSLVAKRFMLLRAALVEVPLKSSLDREGLLQTTILKEAIACMAHPAPQVRENVGSLMSVLLSDLDMLGEQRIRNNVNHDMEITVEPTTQSSSITLDSLKQKSVGVSTLAGNSSANACGIEGSDWMQTSGLTDVTLVLVEKAKLSASKVLSLGGPAFGGSNVTGSASETSDATKAESQDAKWMETVLHFIISGVKSGRATNLTRVIVGLLHPLLSLQETFDKDLSLLAKTSIRLLNFHPFPEAHLAGTVEAVLAAAIDSNWHTRAAALAFIQSFVYRHVFILASNDLRAIWIQVQLLLSDTQLEVRELAATTLAGMMKDSDSTFARDFREQSLTAASRLLDTGKARKRGKHLPRQGLSTNAIHGIVLGLAACVLSVPYDMPSWLPEMVTTLGRFSSEPSPIRGAVNKTVSEFRRTHSDTWAYQKSSFSEAQLEVLSDLSSSASYFA